MSHARVGIALVLSLLAVAPALEAGTTTSAFHERRVDRLVATPTPVGPVLVAGDASRWLLDLPAETVVRVVATGGAAALFHLTWHLEGEAPPDVSFPARHQSFEVSGPARWIVRLDPAGGAGFHARITFEGFVSEAGGAPSAFALTDLGHDGACVVPGVCLP